MRIKEFHSHHNREMETIEVRPKTFPTNLIVKDWSNRKCFYNKGGEKFLEMLHDMKVRDDDVWIVTLAKCGTTWMQEMTWLILNDFNFDEALSTDLETRSPFLEFNFMLNPNDVDNALNEIESLPSPRLIKTHHPLPLLPAQVWSKKPKIIYVFRNPKDVTVSSYYHNRSLGFCLDQSKQTVLKQLINEKENDESFWLHVLEFYALRNEPFVYYTSFELMKTNLQKVIEDLCRFLNKPITAEQMERMLEHLSFDKMKSNPKCNHVKENQLIRQQIGLPYEDHKFIRKGEVGGFKDDMSEELVKVFDDWIEKNLSSYNILLDELLLIK